MGLLDKLLVAGGVALVGLASKKAFSNHQDTTRRKNTPPEFTDAISPIVFAEIVQTAVKKTPRVKNFEISGMTVDLQIRSGSGLTTWNSEVDFNDFGNLTGTYWVTSENDKSMVPQHFADLVQIKILQLM